MSFLEFTNYQELTSYFHNFRQANPNKSASGYRYPVLAKKAFVEFSSNKGYSMAELGRGCGINAYTLTKWQNQYSEGLFDDMSSVVSVSSKAKASHSIAVQSLLKEKKRIEEEAQLKLAQLAAQIAAIKTLESNGFSISKA